MNSRKCYVQLRHVRNVISVQNFSNTLEMLPSVRLYKERQKESGVKAKKKKQKPKNISNTWSFSHWNDVKMMIVGIASCNKNKAFFPFSLPMDEKCICTSTESTLSFCICEDGWLLKTLLYFSLIHVIRSPRVWWSTKGSPANAMCYELRNWTG